jgi:hypothetical protein
MRHIRSVLYALVLAPLLWMLCAVGLGRGVAGRGFQAGLTVESTGGIVILLLAGATYAILLLPRLSPAGPILTGLLFVGVTLWSLVNAASFAGVWPASLLKPGFDVTLPAKGLALLLAVPLLGTAFGYRRWRRHDHAPPVAGLYASLATPGPRPAPSKPATTLVAPAVDPSPQQSAEPTQVIGRTSTPAPLLPAGDATQVIRSPRAPAAPPPDATQVLPPPGEAATHRLTPNRPPAPVPGEATHRLTPPPVVAVPAAPADEPTSVLTPSPGRSAEPAQGATAGLSTVDLSGFAQDRTAGLLPPLATADEPTTALRLPADRDRTTTLPPSTAEPEPTTALRPTTADNRTTTLSPATPGDDPTTALRLPTAGDPTTTLPPAALGDDPTTAFRPLTADDRTTTLPSATPGDDPTTTPPPATPGDDPTTALRPSAAEDRTTPFAPPTAEDATTTLPPSAPADEPTTAFGPTTADDRTTAVPHTPDLRDDPTTVMQVRAGASEATTDNRDTAAESDPTTAGADADSDSDADADADAAPADHGTARPDAASPAEDPEEPEDATPPMAVTTPVGAPLPAERTKPAEKAGTAEKAALGIPAQRETVEDGPSAARPPADDSAARP